MKIIAALLALTLATAFCRADAVGEIVDKMPARTSADESALATTLLSGGASAVEEVCAMLAPLGTEGKNDTRARYAISAMVRHAGRSGGEADRAAVVKGLCGALSAVTDWEIKTFLVNRLQEIGRDDAVPALAPLLADEKLALHAAAALERIASPAAINALGKTLPSASGSARVAMIKSLGMLRAAGSAGEIRKSAGDGDKTTRMTALWALANLGDPSADELLGKALESADSAYDKSRLYTWSLLYARQLAAGGKKNEGAAVCMKFLDGANERNPANVQTASARLLAEIQGESSLTTLLPLAERGDIQFRVATLDAIAAMRGETITPALVGRLKASAQTGFKADVLDALAKRRDAAARPAVLDALKDADPAVRLAAIKALVALGRDEAIAPLVEVIVSGSDETAKVATETLARFPGDKALLVASDALNSAPAKAKVALLEMLAGRAAVNHRDAIFKQTADTQPAVRLAALRAMEKVAGEQDVARLVDLALDANDDAERSAALKAAVAGAARIADSELRAGAFLAGLPRAQGAKRAALESAMAKVGGRKALDAVVADLKSPDKPTRDGALAALADWQGSAAIAPLLEAIKSGADPAQKVTAIRGVVQVLKSSPALPAAEKAGAYAQAMSAATRPEEKKMILGALSNERGQAFFDLAASALDDEALQREAALAVIKTALPQGKTREGLDGAKIIEILDRAIPACPDPALKADAQRYLKTLQARK